MFSEIQAINLGVAWAWFVLGPVLCLIYFINFTSDTTFPHASLLTKLHSLRVVKTSIKKRKKCGRTSCRQPPMLNLVSYRRRSLTRVKLREIFHKEKTGHIYFLEIMSWVQFLGYNIIFAVNPFCFFKFFFIPWVAW